MRYRSLVTAKPDAQWHCSGPKFVFFPLLGTYNHFDLTPKGRNEEGEGDG